MAGIVVDHLLTRFDLNLRPVGLYRVASGAAVDVTARRSTDVYYVLAGTAYFSLGGHTPVLCHAGGMVIVPPGQTLIIVADTEASKDPPLTDVGLTIREDFLLFDTGTDSETDLCVVSAVVTATGAGSIASLNALNRPIVVPRACGELMRHAYRSLHDEIVDGGPGSCALIASLMKTCLLLLMRQHVASGKRIECVGSAVHDPRLDLAIEAVAERPAAPHSVASLGRRAGMSRSAFARAFSEQVAVSPMAFVARTRLHRAAELLATTRLPVGEIATTVGFASRSHFSRAFRAAYGVDPSGFRDKAVASDAVALPRRAGLG